MPDPILILQMQRMGDLVLTFPLLLWLRNRFPKRPIRVVAERVFFEGLLPVSPDVTYIPWEGAERLRKEKFHLLFNLSHREEAARLAASLRAETIFGAMKPENAPQHIHGDWQLYRANLVQNNRHNQFHWAELNALDTVDSRRIATTGWPAPDSKKQGRIGLFLGASQPEKRPKAVFWAALADELKRRNMVPVLLGGPAEVAWGARVKKFAKTPVVNLCGRFDLQAFVRSLRELDLLVTPDTGPMHLAAWLGVPCLNLSMGPVNPWETGPYQPGHHVLQAAMSCVNCWHCTNPVPYRCRELFLPSKTAFLIQRLAQNKLQGLERLRLGSMRLLRTGRDRLGLYQLQRLDNAPPGLRERAGAFWSTYFGMLFGLTDESTAKTAWQALKAENPALAAPLGKGVQRLGQGLSRSLNKGTLLDEAFWRQSPPLLRPLSGYLHLLLQNHAYTTSGSRQALVCLERLSALWG